MSSEDAARVTIRLGNSRVELGELFSVDGSTGDETLLLEGHLGSVHGIGRGMSRGSLEIRGAVGGMFGSGMSGGTIDLHGSAGDWLGAEMTGGLIRVRGSAGHYVGAAFPGSRSGMREGAILIEGSAGNDVGLMMRRGLIAILDDAGTGVGRNMIAGTIFLGGKVGRQLGAGMKRGSLVLLDPGIHPEEILPPTFIRAGDFSASWLVIYGRQLASWGFPLPFPRSILSAPFRRYNGDTVGGGQGEVLVSTTSR